MNSNYSSDVVNAPIAGDLGDELSTKALVKLPSATSVVARSYPDKIIGIENSLPWHLGTDLKHFKNLTSGHAIILGRKTYESIGRPLPKRLNIVLSRTEIEEIPGLRWAPNPETALLMADQHSIINLQKEFYVIGGENIYDIFDEYINVVYLTDVFSGSINGDAKFERDFDPREWWFRFEREFAKSEIDDFPFRISCIVRRKPFHRFAARKELNMLSGDALKAWSEYQEIVSRSKSDPMIDESQLDLLEAL